MSNQHIKKVLANIMKQDQPVSLNEAMGRYNGAVNKKNRELKWKRFVPNTPLPVPQLMRDELSKTIDSYKANFAPFTKSESAKKIFKNFNGMVFSWYTADPAVSPADMKDLGKEAKVAQKADPAQAQKLGQMLKLADFIQKKGIQLLQPGDNLSDKHLSDCGFAFADMVPVVKGQYAASFKTLDIRPKNDAEAQQYAQQRPEERDKMYKLEVKPTQTGAFGLFASYLNGKSQPALQFNPRLDLSSPDTYKINYKKYLKGGVVPGSSYVYLPNGPKGEIQPVYGRPAMLQRHQAENAHEEMKRYQRPDGSHRVYSDMMKNPQEAPHVYKLLFDGPEGGLVVKNVSDGQSFALSEPQVKSLLSPGKNADGSYRTDTESRWMTAHPEQKTQDAFGQDKGVGAATWEMSPESKELVRAKFKPLMDELSTYLNQKRAQRMADTGSAKKLHTPEQSYVWVTVSPRYERGEIVDDKGRGKSRIFNKKYMPPAANGAPAPTPDAPVSLASITDVVKTAQNVQPHDPGVGERDWVCVTNDVAVGELAAIGNKRFPSETLSGESDQGFATLADAINYAMTKLGATPDQQKYMRPSEQVIKAAEAAFAAAKGEMDQMQPDMNTPEMQEVQMNKKKRAELSATTQKAQDSGQVVPINNGSRTILELDEQGLSEIFGNIFSMDQEEADFDAQSEAGSQPTDVQPQTGMEPQEDPNSLWPSGTPAESDQPVAMPKDNAIPSPVAVTPPMGNSQMAPQPTAPVQQKPPQAPPVNNQMPQVPEIQKPKRRPKRTPIVPPTTANSLLRNVLRKHGL